MDALVIVARNDQREKLRPTFFRRGLAIIRDPSWSYVVPGGPWYFSVVLGDARWSLVLLGVHISSEVVLSRSRWSEGCLYIAGGTLRQPCPAERDPAHHVRHENAWQGTPTRDDHAVFTGAANRGTPELKRARMQQLVGPVA